MVTVTDYYLGLQNHCKWWLQPWNKKRHLLLGRKAMMNLDSILKSRDITLLIKVQIKTVFFSSSHVRMWELDHKKGWTPNNWCLWTVVLEKILESPLIGHEIKPVNPKENQSWIFILRIDAEAPIHWPPDAKSRLIGKSLMLGDWRQDLKGKTEDGMIG